MTIQAQTALLARLTGQAGAHRAQPRGVDPPAPQAPSADHDLHGRLRRRGPADGGQGRHLGDSGAYASVGGKVLERAAGHACGPYRTPAVDIESIAAYTNNPPCGAMRGFGVNQASFAIEGCLDLLADKVGHRRLGDALAQHRAGRRRADDRADPGKVGRPRRRPCSRSSRPMTRRAPRGARSASPAA